MVRILRRRTKPAPSAEFCDGCAQVCTATCRSEAHLQRARTSAAAQHYPFIR